MTTWFQILVIVIVTFVIVSLLIQEFYQKYGISKCSICRHKPDNTHVEVVEADDDSESDISDIGECFNDKQD